MEEGEVLDIEHFEARGEKRSQDDVDDEEDGTLSIKPPPVPTKKHKKHHKNKEEKRNKKHKKKRSKSKERNRDETSRSRFDERDHSRNRERGKEPSRRVKVSTSASRNVDTRISRPQRPKSRERDDKSHSTNHPHKFDQRRLGYNNDNRGRGNRYDEPSRDRGYQDKSRGRADYRRGGGSHDRRQDKPMLVRRIDDSEDNERRGRGSDGGNYSRDSRRRRDGEYDNRDHHRSRSDNLPRAEHRIQRVISPPRSPAHESANDVSPAHSDSEENSGSEAEEPVSTEERDETQESDEHLAESLDEKDSDKEEASSEDASSSAAEEDNSSESSDEGEESASGEEGEEEETINNRGNVRSKFDSSPEEEEEESAVEANDNEDQNEEDSSSQENEASDDQEEEEEQDPTPEPSPEVLKPDLPFYLPAIQGCRSVDEFQCLNRIEEGTYGVVYRAKDKKTQEVVALKRLKMEKEREGFPITSLREVCTLLKAHHPNIVKVQEIVVGSNMDKIYIVMDYVEHDMKSLMETMKQPFLIGEVKTLMIQLLRGVHHLHDNWILHRDLKTSNLLLSHNGILKIGDFGLAREYGSPLKPYTPIVVTLWYRAPELLLGCKKYSTLIDVWSVGCIFAEFLTLKPLFPGKSEIIQLNLIFKELGTPSERIWPGYSELPIVKKATFTDYPYNKLRKRFDTRISEKGMDLLNSFLTYCPSKRTSCGDALSHEWFKETPLPVDPAMFPTWPAKSELSKAKKVGHSPKAPAGGMGYDKLLDKEDMMAGFQLTAPKHGLSKQGMGFKLKF